MGGWEWKKLTQWKLNSKIFKDEAEIRIAKATLGNFHLKTAADYVVPEHLRCNTKQKRRQIAFLTKEIHSRKVKFNKKVRQARNKKIEIRESIIQLSDSIGKKIRLPVFFIS